MTSNIERLVSIGTPPLSDGTPRLTGECLELAGALGPQLLQLLWARNGFFAFESALHVRPLSDYPGEFGIFEWNQFLLWRHADALFFAEDIFGGQFCIAHDKIHRFDPETAESHEIAQGFEDWAGLILSDSDAQTGWPLAHAWQKQNGPLGTGRRLVPITPFVLGGDFVVHNLALMEDVRAMQFYGELARQIHGAREGTKIEFRVDE